MQIYDSLAASPVRNDRCGAVPVCPSSIVCPIHCAPFPRDWETIRLGCRGPTSVPICVQVPLCLISFMYRVPVPRVTVTLTLPLTLWAGRTGTANHWDLDTAGRGHKGIGPRMALELGMIAEASRL